MKNFKEFMNERLNYLDKVNPYRESPYAKKIAKLNHEEQAEINDLDNKIRNIRNKYSKLKNELQKDDQKDIENFLRKRLIGKTIYTIRSRMDIHMYPTPNINYGTVIDKVKDVKLYNGEKDEAEYDYYGNYSCRKKVVLVDIILENGEIITVPYKSMNISILDGLLKFLEMNKGNEFSFYGFSLKGFNKSLTNFKKKKESGDKLSWKYKQGPLSFLFYNKNKKHFSLTLESVEIVNIPEVSNSYFLSINGKYLFYFLNNDYEFVKRSISEKDPYGEEDWDDETEERQEIFRKRHGINQNYMPTAMYPEDENEYDQGDWDDVGWGEDA